MKPSSQPPRTPSDLSDSLQRHLNTYALAASAAGAGMLALAQPAEAKIVYTKTYKHIARFVPFRLDLTHDGTSDFVLGNYTDCSGNRAWLSVHPAQVRNAFRGHRSNFEEYSSASALPAGVAVGSNEPFLSGKGMMVCDCWPNSGSWRNKKGYLGLKFQIRGKTHFGWARLTVDTSYQIGAILTGYAYESVPNKAIVTGKTKGPEVITADPGSLGALAAGASRPLSGQ